MIAPTIALVLLFAAQPQNGSADSATVEQRAHDEYERHRRAAIRINDLAEHVQSEADATALVSEVATLFSKELPPAWFASGTNQRVAEAEYQSGRDPAKRIPEERIVNVWNQYVREIGAPDEAVVTAAEIHNMRDAQYTVAQHLWARGNQNIWTVPNIYAVRDDGKVADGCRAFEPIRVIYDLDRFQNLRSARDRVRKGVQVSEQVKNRVADPRTQGGVLLTTHSTEENPVRFRRIPLSAKKWFPRLRSVAQAIVRRTLPSRIKPRRPNGIRPRTFPSYSS